MVAKKLLPAGELRCVSTFEDLSATVYLNTMKSVKRPGLPALLDLLTSAQV